MAITRYGLITSVTSFGYIDRWDPPTGYTGVMPDHLIGRWLGPFTAPSHFDVYLDGTLIDTTPATFVPETFPVQGGWWWDYTVDFSPETLSTDHTLEIMYHDGYPGGSGTGGSRSEYVYQVFQTGGLLMIV
jgi:hypothetical protein